MRRLSPFVFWPLALGLVVLCACVLAAPVHELLMDLGWMTRHGDPHQADRYFLKVFRRLLLVPLLFVFLWRVRPWQGGSGSYGLCGPEARLRPALLGYFGVMAVLVGVLAFQFERGWLRLEEPLRWGEIAWRGCKYLVAGFAAGFLEEWFFRGWLSAQIQRNHGRAWLSVLLSSLVYAGVHAFRPSTLAEAPTHDAAGAFAALGAWVAHGVSAEFLAAAAGLFCFALLLTAVYRRTGTLWTAVFVHAGAVLVLSSYGALTDRPEGLTPAWAGTRLLYDGLPVMGLLLLGAWIFRPRSSARDPRPLGG